MGTNAIDRFCHIAVKAKHLKAIGKIVLYQPPNYVLARMNTSTMLSTIIVDMINSKKLRLRLATAGTLLTIMFQNRYPLLLIMHMLLSSLLISMCPIIPTSLSSCLLFVLRIPLWVTALLLISQNLFLMALIEGSMISLDPFLVGLVPNSLALCLGHCLN